ncbi:hypothetical protein BDV59DRAFT_136963 [Aspergillus ambiguus]|uniref:uncharacterized protein n=1 Tax=Aspergillus ambiguus TaxID=176160 RepID=UPI003CCCCA81
MCAAFHWLIRCGPNSNQSYSIMKAVFRAEFTDKFSREDQIRFLNWKNTPRQRCPDSRKCLLGPSLQRIYWRRRFLSCSTEEKKYHSSTELTSLDKKTQAARQIKAQKAWVCFKSIRSTAGRNTKLGVHDPYFSIICILEAGWDARLQAIQEITGSNVRPNLIMSDTS